MQKEDFTLCFLCQTGTLTSTNKMKIVMTEMKCLRRNFVDLPQRWLSGTRRNKIRNDTVITPVINIHLETVSETVWPCFMIDTIQVYHLRHLHCEYRETLQEMKK